MNTSKCPCCGNTGDVTETVNNQEAEWKCSVCNFDWDINEEFLCLVCGKNMQGRILFCSDECEELCSNECEEEAEKESEMEEKLITQDELYATTDAAVWTKAFIQRTQKNGDFGFIIGWFANAIETAKTHERRKYLDMFHKILKTQGMNITDEYMRGMYNGMVVFLKCMDENVEYIEANSQPIDLSQATPEELDGLPD